MPLRCFRPYRATLLSVLGGLAFTHASSAHALNVRVLLVSASQVTVRIPPNIALKGAPPASTPWKVGVVGSGAAAHLSLNGKDAGNATLYLRPTAGSTVEVSGAAYRGGLLLRVQAGSVQAINVVDVDDYVRGVVASEMPASWPRAALNTQAIIARTYVAARINPDLPYDTCDNESCQVYGGVAAETAQTDAAVRATAGQVVSYRGKAASTYFSSDSGGFTASAAEVWGMRGLPYLPAQPDPFSAGGPRATWKFNLTQPQVENAADRLGVRLGRLSRVTVNHYSDSGRPQEITFVGATGTTKLTGTDAMSFIKALGARGNRVTLSGLSPMTVSGSGNGHGVGLSQYGAYGMAQKGYDHLHILGFYYPGTVLSALAGTPQSGPVLAQLAPLPGLHTVVATHELSQKLLTKVFSGAVPAIWTIA